MNGTKCPNKIQVVFSGITFDGTPYGLDGLDLNQTFECPNVNPKGGKPPCVFLFGSPNAPTVGNPHFTVRVTLEDNGQNLIDYGVDYVKPNDPTEYALPLFNGASNSLVIPNQDGYASGGIATITVG